MSEPDAWPEHHCPHCNDTYHDIPHDCPEYPDTLTEQCPVCGAPIGSFLSHMSDCPGPRGDDGHERGHERGEPTTAAAVGELDSER